MGDVTSRVSARAPHLRADRMRIGVECLESVVDRLLRLAPGGISNRKGSARPLATSWSTSIVEPPEPKEAGGAQHTPRF